MQYLGGKSRLVKYIVPLLESYRKPGQVYIEPFVGGANIVSNMSGERVAYDIHYELIDMMIFGNGLEHRVRRIPLLYLSILLPMTLNVF